MESLRLHIACSLSGIWIRIEEMKKKREGERAVNSGRRSALDHWFVAAASETHHVSRKERRDRLFGRLVGKCWDGKCLIYKPDISPGGYLSD